MMDLHAADIARALGGRKAGKGWIAKCVCHDDRSPSLSLADGDDGHILVKCHTGCDPRDIIDELDRRGLWPERERQQRYDPDANARRREAAEQAERKRHEDDERRTEKAQQIWRETVDPRGTWAESYLAERGISLPADPEILLRTLRYHPACPWEGERVPALIAAFTPILADVPDDPFLDPPPVAIHRLRGRGHANKRMLGPTAGCAVMISPWWHVWETLHVCEGIETGLQLYGEGRPLEQHRRPVWALGSAGMLETLPVITRVKRLIVWADNDQSGRGIEAAEKAATRWRAAGASVVVHIRNEEGADYGEG